MRPSGGSSTCRCCIALTLSGLSTTVPSSATPPPMCMRANVVRSRARIASIAPAGPLDRARAQIGAGCGSASGSGWMCPTAARCRIASYGLGEAWVSPSGANRCSRRQSSKGRSRSTSTTRPSTQKRGVVVGEPLAGREQLADLGQRPDVPLDAVVALARVGEDVALEAGRVAQQLPDRDRGRGGLVGEPELRHVPPHRRVKVEPALVDELHHQRGRPDLGDRADLEDRVGGRLDPGRLAQYAGREVDHLTVGRDGDRRAGHPVLGHQRGQALGQPGPDLIQTRHAPTVGRVRVAVFVRADKPDAAVLIRPDKPRAPPAPRGWR